jgi:hypothetical protein
MPVIGILNSQTQIRRPQGCRPFARLFLGISWGKTMAIAAVIEAPGDRSAKGDRCAFAELTNRSHE